MTGGSTRENPINTSTREHDDLTVIKGISPDREQKLRKFGFCTLQDLAQISDDQIEAVSAEMKGVSANMMKNWRAEARERLLSQRNTEITTANIEPNSPAEEGEWEYIAAFAVEFKARKAAGIEETREINVRPVEITKDGTWGDVTDEKPTVVEGERLYPWMLEQVVGKSPVQPEKEPQIEPEEEPPVEVKPAEAPSVMVKIQEVQAFQPPQAKTPTAIAEAAKQFQGFLVGDEPFDLRVSFDLVGPGADAMAKTQIPCRAQILTRKLPIGERAVLGETEPHNLTEIQKPYTVKLPEVSLSPGMYRLRVLVRLLSTPPIGDYLEVPLLQVV